MSSTAQIATQNAIMPTRESLLAETPKIDEALKNFYSYLAAGQQQQQQQQPATKTTTDSNTVLKCTRFLSKAVNSHVMAIGGGTKKKEMTTDSDCNDAATATHELVQRVWNEQAGTPGVRITKTLGQTCLAHAWSTDLQEEALALYRESLDTKPPAVAASASATNDEYSDEQDPEQPMVDYLHRFGQLLLLPQLQQQQQQQQQNAALIWSADRGQAELARRAQARQASAQARVQEQEQWAKQQLQQHVVSAATTPTIEELPEEKDATL